MSLDFSRFILVLFLIWSVFSPEVVNAREVRLRLIHLNDFHGFALPQKVPGGEGEEGGAAYMAYQVEQLRRQHPTLLLAAGDMVHGDNWANLFKGASVIALMNLMGFDAMALGNHDFNYGQQVLEQLIAAACFPVLGANVQGVKGLQAFVVKSVGGLRVALIGVVTSDVPVTTHPRNVMGLTFVSPEEAVRALVGKLRPQVDLVIVISHQGYAQDRELAARVPGLDVIVGGHSHTKLEEPAVVAGVIIVQAYEHGRRLGVLDLTWRDGKIVAHEGRLLPIRPASGQSDPKVAALVARYQKKVDQVLGEPVGYTDVVLEGDSELVRTRETNLGNLVADIIRAKTKAEVALINGGSIRKSIPPGPIRRREVYAALPFDNYLVALRLTGRQLKEALEHGVSKVEEHAGAFPQVSGLSFTYDPKGPPGSRVREVLVGGQPLEMTREYVVATNDFLVAGGDGYRMFQEALGGPTGYENVGGVLKSPKLVYVNPGRWLREEVVDFLRAHPRLAPRVEGRIRESQ
uniref:Bifunctional metallophosphatase/5'-nucleotidase n=1 Tax=Desulfobacca acetoxidans TaxID=60893 RepID=A0A7C5EV89_9BACT